MKNSPWDQAVKECADPQQARHYLELLKETDTAVTLAKAATDEARIFCALFAGSQALSAWLVAHPALVLSLTPERLEHPRRKQGLQAEIDGELGPFLAGRDYATGLEKLREFKQKEMLRIGARDLARLGRLNEIVQELSDVADVCLGMVWKFCGEQLSDRLGRPFHQDADGRWRPTGGCVLGLGKLGGQELNYSSDVDVIFVYAEEGGVFKQPPGKSAGPGGGLTNHQYFNRLAEMFIAEVGRMTAAGMLYRIDLRLRPEGDAGPLTRSLAGYENYYSQWGQTWERMMLIKARCVAGDKTVGAEFMEMIQPFRFSRSPGAGVLREVAAMKGRIETEVVKAGELDRNVKLGRGGIREIEFIAQTLQLIHAGRQPFLQGSQTLPVLAKAVDYGLLKPADARQLTEAYVFLREVEHRLQMEDNRQTHTIPVSVTARKRLAKLMGCGTEEEFELARRKHTNAVRGVYDELLKGEKPPADGAFPRQFIGSESQWQVILAEHHFKNVEHSIKLLHEFASGPGYVHVSNRTVELARQLLPRLFALCRIDGSQKGRLSDPDRVVTRLDSFITAYGARAMLFETWNSNPSLFELLLLLFDRSEFLAEVAIHTPDLVDELVLSGRLRQRKSAAEILTDLRHGRGDADQRLWLRRYHQAELMRIGLRDILGLADFEQNLVELSGLADACLQYSLEVTLRGQKLKAAPLAIIGLGKLGGAEINYGSDLDILFVTDAPAARLPKLQRIATDVMELLSSRTELGVAFLTDARLRPDGEKGLLVNTLEAHEDYYRNRAQLWEIQSISRARPVAGNAEVGEKFQALAEKLADFTPENVAANFQLKSVPKTPAKSRSGKPEKPGLAAYAPDWREQIQHMRLRIEKERTPAGKDSRAIKTGSGGLMDAEFLAQSFCLAQGWQEANTLRALVRARDSGILARPDAETLIENYRRLRRVEGILRRWSFEGETVLPDEAAPFYRVAVRCGFATAEAFQAAIAQYRRSIREVYNKVFCR